MTPQWLFNAMVHYCLIFDRVLTGVDEYGNEVYETQQVGTSRCLLQAAGQAEIQLGRAGVGSFSLFLPGDVLALLSPFSAFEIEGVLYEAEGPPAPQSSLYDSSIHHVEVAVGRGTA